MNGDDDDCLFCQIVRRSVPSNIVFQDDRVFAFMDTSPINPGHLLVIPKGHPAYLEELEPSSRRYFMSTSTSFPGLAAIAFGSMRIGRVAAWQTLKNQQTRFAPDSRFCPPRMK